MCQYLALVRPPGGPRGRRRAAFAARSPGPTRAPSPRAPPRSTSAPWTRRWRSLRRRRASWRPPRTSPRSAATWCSPRRRAPARRAAARSTWAAPSGARRLRWRGSTRRWSASTSARPLSTVWMACGGRRRRMGWRPGACGGGPGSWGRAGWRPAPAPRRGRGRRVQCCSGGSWCRCRTGPAPRRSCGLDRPLPTPAPPRQIPFRRPPAANRVKAERGTTYDLRVEGDVTERVTATLDPAIDTARCTFLQVRGGTGVALCTWGAVPAHAARGLRWGFAGRGGAVAAAAGAAAERRGRPLTPPAPAPLPHPPPGRRVRAAAGARRLRRLPRRQPAVPRAQPGRVPRGDRPQPQPGGHPGAHQPLHVARGVHRPRQVARRAARRAGGRREAGAVRGRAQGRAGADGLHRDGGGQGEGAGAGVGAAALEVGLQAAGTHRQAAAAERPAMAFRPRTPRGASSLCLPLPQPPPPAPPPRPPRSPSSSARPAASTSSSWRTASWCRRRSSEPEDHRAHCLGPRSLAVQKAKQ
jgi:hypothetical protein